MYLLYFHNINNYITLWDIAIRGRNWLVICLCGVNEGVHVRGVRAGSSVLIGDVVGVIVRVVRGGGILCIAGFVGVVGIAHLELAGAI